MRESEVLIDFHAHILPGADHGSDSMETSAAQLKLLFEGGVGTVVATPHFYPQRDSVSSFLERRERTLEKLLSGAKGNRPRICAGAEVLVCPGIDHMPGLSRLFIEGTDVILLEMPFGPWSRQHIEAVEGIVRMGAVVVMAHIDRYSPSQIKMLSSQCDVLYQLNGETQKTLSGRKKARDISRELTVAAIGSDIHGADKKAVKNLVRLSKSLDREGADINEMSSALLEKALIY